MPALIRMLGVTSGCSGSLLSSIAAFASSFASCKRMLACVIPVKVRYRNLKYYSTQHLPSLFTLNGLYFIESASQSSTCCFHNANCSGNLSSSDRVNSAKSPWCSLCSEIASLIFLRMEGPTTQEVLAKIDRSKGSGTNLTWRFFSSSSHQNSHLMCLDGDQGPCPLYLTRQDWGWPIRVPVPRHLCGQPPWSNWTNTTIGMTRCEQEGETSVLKMWHHGHISSTVA